MDSILQKLLDERLSAAKKFMASFGDHYGQGDQKYSVLGTDKNGYIKLKNLTTGKESALDPIGVVYRDPNSILNAGGAGTSTGVGGAGGQNPFMNAISLASQGTGALTALKQNQAADAQTKFFRNQQTGPNGENLNLLTQSRPRQFGIDTNTFESWMNPTKPEMRIGGTPEIAGPPQGPGIKGVDFTGLQSGSALTPPPGISAADWQKVPEFLRPHTRTIYENLDRLNVLAPKVQELRNMATRFGYGDGQGNLVDLPPQVKRVFDDYLQTQNQVRTAIGDFNNAADKFNAYFHTPTTNVTQTSTVLGPGLLGSQVTGPTTKLGESQFSKDWYRALYDTSNPYSVASKNLVENQIVLAKWSTGVVNRFQAQQQAFFDARKSALDNAVSLNNRTMTTAERDRALSELFKEGYEREDIEGSRLLENRVESIRRESLTKLGLTQENMSQYYQDHRAEVDGLQVSDGKGGMRDATLTEKHGYIAEKILSKNGANYDKLLRKQQLGAERNKFLGSLAGAATSGWGIFASISGMVEKGKASFAGIAGYAGSMLGLIVSMGIMHSALANGMGELTVLGETLNNIKGLQFMHLGSVFKGLSSGPGQIGIIGAVTLLGILMGKSGDEEEDAVASLNEEVAPVVWHDGPVLLLTAGLALSSMGINLSPSAPLMQEITVPQLQMTQALARATGGSIPDDSQRYGSVFVQQGVAGQPTRVVFLTPAGVDKKGNIIETAKVITLDPGTKFTSPGSAGYIPFFVKDKTGKTVRNPKAVAAIDNQQRFLTCADGTRVSTRDAQGCANHGGVASHDVNPDVGGGGPL